ncbi:TPA: hypothetical protein I8646_002795 [Legionella pneumophila]|nr:hypothetical protein [Legionella pneumophila]HAT1785420.1 hypothetical protein [Legionella pneumophila]HAT2064461.1 hypothetical protein [Legionella pneumophila]HAT2066795.1 hypothetical protein [Legionella pneumophila]HAT3819431.1 hypothetical protein [Legionella pneumophila]
MLFRLGVSVVGFLDEGLLVQVWRGLWRVFRVSVVGFLDEGLLAFSVVSKKQTFVSFSGWIFR